MAETDGSSRGLYGFDARVAHPARGLRLLARRGRTTSRPTGSPIAAIRASARANRAFLARTWPPTRASTSTRVPMASNTLTEVAQSVAPESRVVYVDTIHWCCRTPARC